MQFFTFQEVNGKPKSLKAIPDKEHFFARVLHYFFYYDYGCNDSCNLGKNKPNAIVTRNLRTLKKTVK